MKYCSTLFFLLVVIAATAQTAPNFTVTNSDGQTRNLYTDYLNQGKVVVIEAFFTTCPPCNTHAPYWQTLYQNQLAAHPGKVEFLMLSTLQSDNNAKVAQYKANKSLTMPGVGNDGGSLTALQPYTSGQFGDFFGTPTFILIKPDGEVVYDIHSISPQATMDLIAQNIAATLTQNCKIETPFGSPIPDVQISAVTPNMNLNITASGTYSLSNLPPLQSTTYTITATKPDEQNPLGGITTFDLVLISKHILQLDTFTQDWQYAAADLNCNGMVTTYDIVVARKLILGIDNNLACGSWKFIPLGSNMQSNGGCVDLQGVRLGDITGPYFAPPPSERSPFTFYATDRHVESGERFTLELTANEWAEIRSLQLDLDIDPNILKINQIESPVLAGFGSDCYRLSATDEGHLPVLWIDGSVAKIYPNSSVLSIEMTAQQSGKISEMLHVRSNQLPAEMYDADLQPIDIDLQWRNAEQIPAETVSIFPNPAHDQFQIHYQSEVEEDQKVQLVDMQGKMVLQKTVQTRKGENWQKVLAENVTPGLYFVKMDGRSIGRVSVF